MDQPRYPDANSQTQPPLQKFRRTPTDLNWSNYKVQRNRVTALKKKAVKDFCINAATTKSCPGLVWKKMKPLLPNNNTSGDSLNDIFLLDNGKVASNPCATLNESFANPRIQESVLNLSEDDFTDHPSIVTIKSKHNPLNFSFTEINSETMIAYLSKIEAKKSTGHDGLSPKILKLSTPSLVDPLTTLFNYCIRTSTLPSSWKMSNVSPIYKKGDTSDKNNYRPVSVIPAISKLFEKVLFDQLYSSFLPTFSPNKSGFLRGHSTATAQIKLTDDWRKSLDEKQEVGVVAIDLSKAFDCICHNLLLAKSKAYGLHDTALKLLRSFLHERKQRVMCNNSCSNWTPIRCGVPQGSLLSPLLFNIFMNDINEAVNDSSLRLYADDTTQYMADKNPTILQFSLNQDMERLSSWLDHNYLQANGDKTQAMVLGKSTHHYDLKFNGAPIDIKEQLKILGVHLDNKLTFQEHISEILKKVFAKIAALRRLKRLVPCSTLLALYRCFLLSHFEYCNSLLIGIGKTLNKKLEDANHYGLRTIMNLGRNINYESILRTADMNTLEHRRIEQALIIFYKCYKENGPSYLADLFEPRITPYNLRNTGLNVTQNS